MSLLRLQVCPRGSRGQGRQLIRRIGLAGICLTLAYLGAALIGGIVPGAHGTVQQGDARTVHLLRGSIHYDFLIPLDDVTKARLGWLALDLEYPGADWLVMGWGGRDFYTTTGTYRDVSARAIWKGVTGDASVMRVALAGPMQTNWPTHPVTMSEAQYSRFLTVVTDSFAEKAPLDVPGFSEFDRFYPAKGRFHIFRTCNVWIGETLRSSGIRFGGWTPTPFAVTLSARYVAE